MDEAAVSELLRRPPRARPTEDEQANLNAIQAYEFIDYLSDQADIPIDELVIRQINRDFMRGAAETLTPGVYRKGQNTVGAFQPPNQGDVPALMRSFAVWMRSDDDLNPIIRAGVAHIHLVAIHPFWDGNGRTARGLATLILQRSPFNFRKLLSLEKFIFDIRDDYFTAVERTLETRFRPDYDATSWLEFFTSTVLGQVSHLVGSLSDWHRMMSELYRLAETAGLNHRQADGFMFATRKGRLTRADYIEITGASPITASRDLAQMVKLGLFKPEGKTRARVYIYDPESSKLASDDEDGEQLRLVEEDGTDS